MKKTNYRMGKDLSYDVVLCTTKNRKADQDVAVALLRHSISFTRSEKKRSLVQRMRGSAAKNTFVISVNRNEYYKARRAILNLSPGLLQRLSISAI